jgi:nucleoside-diphosphate-sugar epimerase|tara:strand:+ start:1 stop:957 length:957 start_codon:yes stop_codon:yes gene_type:complete
MRTDKILITGAGGQLGTVLTTQLQKKHGFDNVIASDLRRNASFEGNFEVLDVTDFGALKRCVLKNEITQIYHLVAILSAKGEEAPLQTWDVNMGCLFNVLEVSRLCKIDKIFYPSSIAVFGNNIEMDNTPQSPNLTPLTVYGISKASGENWVNYYYKKYGMDIRSIRYPGVIGYQSLPGGGTTDYAVDIFHKAIKEELFSCFLSASTNLPLIFIEDAIRATIELMEAPAKNIKVRTSYNLAGFSCTPEKLYNAVKEVYPDFKIAYKPDFRQDIADSWPNSIDDSSALNDWGWEPKFNLESMTAVMITELKKIYKTTAV